MDINEVILAELRELRATVEELAADTRQRISTLEARTKPLFDNGQPGWCNLVERRITALEHWRIYVAGIAAAISIVIGLGIRLLT